MLHSQHEFLEEDFFQDVNRGFRNSQYYIGTVFWQEILDKLYFK